MTRCGASSERHPSVKQPVAEGDSRRRPTGSFAGRALVDTTGRIGYLETVTTLSEIEKAIETLPLPERLRLYKDMPQLIGRDLEDLDWQRLAIERFFEDDSPEDR